MENITKLLARHEALKSKGLSLTEKDAMDWLNLYDEMWDILTELESEKEEKEIQLKLDRGIKWSEIAEDYSNAKKLELALDVIFIDELKDIATLSAKIRWCTRKYSSLWKYHDMSKKIIYK